jgi:hypothetical protein
LRYVAGCFSNDGQQPISDVIKTRDAGTKASQYKNTLDRFKQIIANEASEPLCRCGAATGRRSQGIIFKEFRNDPENSLEKNVTFFQIRRHSALIVTISIDDSVLLT